MIPEEFQGYQYADWYAHAMAQLEAGTVKPGEFLILGFGDGKKRGYRLQALTAAAKDYAARQPFTPPAWLAGTPARKARRGAALLIHGGG